MLALFENQPDDCTYSSDKIICIIDDHDKFYEWVKENYQLSDKQYISLIDGEYVTGKVKGYYFGGEEVYINQDIFIHLVIHKLIPCNYHTTRPRWPYHNNVS